MGWFHTKRWSWDEELGMVAEAGKLEEWVISQYRPLTSQEVQNMQTRQRLDAQSKVMKALCRRVSDLTKEIESLKKEV